MGHSTARFEAIKAITNYKPTDPPLTSMGLAAADVTLNGPAPGAHFGQVVTAGDINRDTGEDVATGGECRPLTTT